MSRDHSKLRVFHAAHQLVIHIYQETRSFPRDEWYGLRQQLRRSAVSIVSNIVEGSARRTTRDYCSFLNIALGSACELAYLVMLSTELELLAPGPLTARATSVVRQLQRLADSAERLRASEEGKRPRAEARDASDDV